MSPVCLGRQIEEPKKMNKKTKYFRTLSAEAPSSKTSGCFLFFCFFGDPRFPNLWKFVVFCIYEYSKHLVISEMSLSGAKFPEVWEFGGSKKPGVSKKPKKKNKKKNNFPEVFALGASAERVLKYFLVFWKPQVFWNHQIPKPLENCIFWYFWILKTSGPIWNVSICCKSYKKSANHCLYLVQNFQKKTYANQWKTALSGTPVLLKNMSPFNTHSGNGVVIDCGLPHDNLSERPKRTGRKVVVRWSDHDSKHASLQSRSANVKLQKCDKIDEDRKS